ncbi:MAG: ABC transporter substrate-binding protein [Dehalococcoidia bacterium]
MNIGLLYPLTGVASGFGNPIVDGFKFAFDRINAAGGVKNPNGMNISINPVLVDTESSPDVAPQKAEELGNRSDILLVSGVSQSAAVLQVAQVFARLNVPLLCSVDARDELTSSGFTQTFRIPPGFDTGSRFIVRAMDEIGTAAGEPMTKVAIIYHSGVPAVGDSMEEEATKLGFNVAEKISYDSQTEDFTTMMVRLKDTGVDGLILNVLSADAIKLVQVMKQLDYNPLGVGAHAGGFNDAGFVATLGADAENMITAGWFFTDEQVDGADAVVNEWKQTTGNDIPILAPLGISAAAVVANALSRVEELSREALIQALSETDMQLGEDDFLVANGCKFDATGVNTAFVHVVGQYQGGVGKSIWPPDIAGGEAVWPRPAWS